MIKNIISVIVGYITIFTIVFVSFTLLYIILGPEGSFISGSYEVSGTWIIFSIILGLVAAVLGGYICMLISKNRKAALVLAGVVLILGIIFALPDLTNLEGNNKIHKGDLTGTEAMQKVKQPAFTLILNPILGAIGVIAGSRLKKEKDINT